MSRLVNPSSYWDLLPLEIQLNIMQLADRAYHRDRLRVVHEVLERFWNICRCGPYHVLKEYLFIKKRKWKITCGIRRSLERQGYRGFNRRWERNTPCCRKHSDSDDE